MNMSREPTVADLQNFIGHRVIIGCNLHGILRYFGVTHFSDAAYCGIELDIDVGNNDGSVHGIRYFTCRENYGVFVSAKEIKIINDESGTYLKVSAFFPAVIEKFIPNKSSSFDHEENLSPKSSQDADSDESLGILSHLCSLDELTDSDDLFFDNVSKISSEDHNFDIFNLGNSNNYESLKDDKNKSNPVLNSTIVHDQVTVSCHQTIDFLSQDDLSVISERDECHKSLNTTVVLQGKTVESDKCQIDLNTTIVLSDRQLEFGDQINNILASDQIIASNEAVNQNKICNDLNSTMIFPDRSVEDENKFCIDLNTTVVLFDKSEESDKCGEIANLRTVEVSSSPIHIFPTDSPKFSSTPKQDINFSFVTDEKVYHFQPSCSPDSQLSYLAKKEKIEAITSKTIPEHLSPIKPNDISVNNEELEPINKLINAGAHIPLPSLNETFDYAKFSPEEKVTQNFEESEFTSKMNIQVSDILERKYEPENILNSPHNDVKASDANVLIQKQEKNMNILNITHSVFGELEDKLDILNLQENASKCKEIKVFDTTFTTDTQKNSEICLTKSCGNLDIPKVTSTRDKKSIPFIKRDSMLSKEETEKKCLKFDRNRISRKSISHFGSSNFTNTESRSAESQNKRKTLSSNKNSLLKNDEMKTIHFTYQKNISSKYSIKENKIAACKQKHLIDTRDANVTRIVREKNERNIMSEDETSVGFKPVNLPKETSKSTFGGNETSIIIPSVIPQNYCETGVKEKDTLDQTYLEKSSKTINLPLQASKSQHKIKSISCLKTRMPIPTLRPKSAAASAENIACQTFPTQPKIEISKMADKIPVVYLNKPSLKKPSVISASSVDKSATVRITEKCVSQKMNICPRISSPKNIRNLDIHNIPICKKENKQEIDVPSLPKTNASSFPPKGVSCLPKKSSIYPPMISAAHPPETVLSYPVDKDITNLPRKPVADLLKASTLVPTSSPKKGETHPPRTSSRIPQRASLKIPRATGSNPPVITRDLPASKGKSVPKNESPKKSQLVYKS